jgi:hypothetical protein
MKDLKRHATILNHAFTLAVEEVCGDQTEEIKPTLDRIMKQAVQDLVYKSHSLRFQRGAKTRSCNVKTKYDTPQDAEQALFWHRSEGRATEKASVYSCKFCRGYHITNGGKAPKCLCYVCPVHGYEKIDKPKIAESINHEIETALAKIQELSA